MKAVIAKRPAARGSITQHREQAVAAPAKIHGKASKDCRPEHEDDPLDFRQPTALSARKPRYWKDCTIYNDRVGSLWRIKEGAGRRDEKKVSCQAQLQEPPRDVTGGEWVQPVSYTHLTLPTIYSV